MQKKRILLPAARWKSTLTILESLGKRGHEIFLIDNNACSPGFYSKYCTKSYLCKDEDKKNYLDFVLELLKKQKIDFIVPTSDLTTEYFSQIREEIRRYTRLILPSEELIDLARNKDKTYRYCLQNGFPIPRTYFPSTLEDVAHCAQELSFPCVVKLAGGTGNEGNFYIQKKEWLVGFYKNYVGKPVWPVIQEFIHGDFGGFSAVCDQGEILAHFIHRAEYKHSKGMPPLALSCTDENLRTVSTRFIKKLGWTGPINLDFLKGKDGEYKLLEINPRFAGSIYFAYKCGVDLPAVLYSLAFGESQPQPQLNYEEGVPYRCVFPSELVYCLQDRKHIPVFIKNFFVPGFITDIPQNDPGLTWGLIRKSMGTLKDEFLGRLRNKLARERKSLRVTIGKLFFSLFIRNPKFHVATEQQTSLSIQSRKSA